MRNISLFLFFLLFFQKSPASISSNENEEISCFDADVLILVDWSISVRSGIPFILESLSVFSERLHSPYMGDVRVGLVAFSDSVFLFSDITSKKENSFAFIETLSGVPAGGNTNMFQALSIAKDKFVLSRGAKSSKSQYLIIISDGEPASRESCEYLGYELKANDVLIFGVFVETANMSMYPSEGEDFLKKISMDDCYFRSDYSMLAHLFENLNICL